MTYKGIARGRMIELTERLPFPEGQAVEVSVSAAPPRPAGALAVAIRQAMHAPPNVESDVVDEFDRVIREGRVDVHERGVFDLGEGA